MNKKELEAALEFEQNGLTSTRQEFENAKSDKKWQEADKLKLKGEVIEGVIEKIKLFLIKHEVANKDKRFDYTNSEKMDKIRTKLESEIVEATNS